PDNELLTTQIHQDLQNLSALKNNLYAFPSDVTSEGEVLKARFAYAVDEFVKTVQDKMIEERSFEGIEFMKEMFERCNRKRLTMTLIMIL
ncbi:hypothetical protein A2U01_0063895, partial [Trifolium medium]|nr:hypothetical protein [Trifolium medium]